MKIAADTMTYPEALSYLGEVRRFGMKLGLDPMHRLAQALDRPQDKLRFIHLAGTNGKGSTAAFCESCLRTAGFRVGLYTSPHLVTIRERIQLNRQSISEEIFAKGMTAIQASLKPAQVTEPTFFELITALALWYFAREKVDWVVWETGLGGRFDATNIIQPEICVITNIDLDHTAYLGTTLREIAAEKAGIIKTGVPVVSSVEKEEAADVIRKKIQQKECLSTLVNLMEVEDLGIHGTKQRARLNGVEYTLGLLGPHQVMNAACAVAVMKHLRHGHAESSHSHKEEAYSILSQAITEGLASTTWPGRFEIISEKPLIVLDGAHNTGAVKKLVQTWHYFLRSRVEMPGELPMAHLVFASVNDKDIAEMAQHLHPLAQKVSLVRLANERTAEPIMLASYFSDLPYTLYESVAALWPQLFEADDGLPILITGSLFLVGEILAHRQGALTEYRLNERLDSSPTTR